MTEHAHDHAHPTEALTAFVVVIPADGGPTYVTTDFGGEYSVQRSATFGDIRRAVGDVLSDFTALAAAQYVAQKSNPVDPQPTTVAERVGRAVKKKAR